MIKYPIKVAFLVVDDRFLKREALPKFGPAPEAILQSLEALGNTVEIHVISCTLNQDQAVLQLAPNIWFHPLNVRRISMIKMLHAGCYLAVRKKLAGLRPDVIHAQGTERWCAWVASFFPQPKVLTIHGNLEVINQMMKPLPRWYWMLQTWMQKTCIGQFDGVFCNSLYTHSEISKRARKTWLVPNPLRSLFFSPLPPKTISRKKVVLNIGVFQPRKRQLELIRLARSLHEQGSSLHFRFIGSLADDSYGRECRDELARAASAGYASHAGVLGPDALLREMDAASALVHIPLEEAFGLVVAEGLARGLKFFGTAVGGVKDITEGVSDACLVNMHDLEGLRKEMLAWERHGCPLSVQGIKLMRQRYGPEAVGGKHLEIYKELLSKP